MTPVPEFALYHVSEILSYLAVVGAAYLALRFVRAYERRSVEPNELRALARRIEYLEVTVETVEDQIRHIAEAQRFTTRLLAGGSELLRAPRE